MKGLKQVQVLNSLNENLNQKDIWEFEEKVSLFYHYSLQPSDFLAEEMKMTISEIN